MKLINVKDTTKIEDLKVNDFFVAETTMMNKFGLRQIVRTEYGYGILLTGSMTVVEKDSNSIADALVDYKNIRKVTLEEVHYKLV